MVTQIENEMSTLLGVLDQEYLPGQRVNARFRGLSYALTGLGDGSEVDVTEGAAVCDRDSADSWMPQAAAATYLLTVTDAMGARPHRSPGWKWAPTRYRTSVGRRSRHGMH